MEKNFMDIRRAGKRNRRRQLRFVQGVLFGLAMWLGCRNLMLVRAAEGTIHFGSESYVWTNGEVCPLGVYFEGDIAVSSYSVCLEYDSAALEYLDGADRTEGNLLWVEGGGGETGYKRMLHFQPLTEGETGVQILSAEGIGIITAEDGTVAEEAFVVGQLARAPIVIQKKGSSRLSELAVGAAEGMEEFSPDVLEYHIQVAYETERLEIEYETEDEEADVILSAEDLALGNNVVTLTVQGVREEPLVYTLYVERKEEPAAAETDHTGTGDGNSTVHPAEPPERKKEEGDGERVKLQENGETNAGNRKADDLETMAPDDAEVDTDGDAKLRPALLAALILVSLMALFYGSELIKQWKKEKKPAAKRKKRKSSALKMINLEKKVIEVRHVTMEFRLARDEASSLKEYVIRSVKRQNHYQILRALDDVSFEVKQGEVVGIIGTNGSGKSTLLKIIAGVLLPTKGEVVVDKRKVQILTLGTGFDMELTARENVYLNGAIIGYSKEYIDEKFEEIVAFAELEGFMDERMKNFSSGMVSRLGFAIATVQDSADILILDEVLSVGDMFFKEKSEARIREMIHSGATVLIVSHSSSVIRKNCDTAVWIERGVLQMVGKPELVCGAYEQRGRRNETA